MDTGSLGIGLVVTFMTVVTTAWYVGVIVLLWKMWRTVRHLPGWPTARPAASP